MKSGELTVDIDLGVIIDGTEVEQYLFALPVGRHADLTLIPDTVDEVLETYARQ